MSTASPALALASATPLAVEPVSPLLLLLLPASGLLASGLPPPSAIFIKNVSLRIEYAIKALAKQVSLYKMEVSWVLFASMALEKKVSLPFLLVNGENAPL